MGKAEYTRESALAKVLRKDGVGIDENLFKRTVIIVEEHANVGNKTWGALDYLARKHGIHTFRKYKETYSLCT